MSNTLLVQLSSKKLDSNEYFEGTVTIPGLKQTKLSRRDNTTQFTSKAAVVSAARSLAKSLGFSDVDVVLPKTATKSTVATAKVSSTKTTKVVAPKVTTNSTSTSTTSTPTIKAAKKASKKAVKPVKK